MLPWFGGGFVQLFLGWKLGPQGGSIKWWDQEEVGGASQGDWVRRASLLEGNQ